jgi:hypothetical protein
VLHINAKDPAGLVPDVLAADIENAPSGIRDWRRWIARRVEPGQRMPLTDALAGIRRERDAALTRLAQLDELSTLLTHGVTTGALTIVAAESVAEPVEAPTHEAPTPTKGSN